MSNHAAPATHTRAKKIIVLDTETTGLLPYDRIVTLGAVRVEGGELLGKGLHLIFDPRKNSHPDAERLHGWDNWTTRFQDLFAELAPGVFAWLSWADLLVMHNAEFDLRYLRRELRKAGQRELTTEYHCTMMAARELWPGQVSTLDACLERVQLTRASHLHGALEDAVLTAGLYLKMQNKHVRLPRLDRLPAPTNFKQPEPRPDGQLPRRSPKRPKAWP